MSECQRKFHWDTLSDTHVFIPPEAAEETIIYVGKSIRRPNYHELKILEYK